MTPKQQVRQLIRDREQSADDRRLPKLVAGKSCSSSDDDVIVRHHCARNDDTKKVGKKDVHCAFERGHMADRSTPLPEIGNDRGSTRNMLLLKHSTTNLVMSSEPSPRTLNKDGSAEAHGRTDTTVSALPLIKLKSLEGLDPVVRDNINVMMLNFIQQARDDLERSKERRKEFQNSVAKPWRSHPSPSQRSDGAEKRVVVGLNGDPRRMSMDLLPIDRSSSKGKDRLIKSR